MESAVFKVDVRAGTVRVKNALFLGTTYAVEIEGYDYTETPPTITLSDHKGNPLAISEVDAQDGYIISLDTQELLDYFKADRTKGCVKAANVHCTVNTTDATLASSTMPVFWSPYFTAPSGTLTKIDVKGPKGDPGDSGEKGDKGDPGAALTAYGFVHFSVDEDSHLWVHASREQDLYAMKPDGTPDTTKPLWVIGDGTGGTTAYHLYYVIYDPGDGQTSRKLDLGYVKGADGEDFSPDIDSVPTGNSGNLVTSGGVAQTISDAGATQAAALNAAVGTINTALGKKADLDSSGKVPISQLPSYVSDIKEYSSAGAFPAEGEEGKIYVAKDTNLTYRWGGTAYVEISQSLALGETSSTAYRGDKGKANADAITAIKDGTSIDSFSDVETAMAGKVSKSNTAGLLKNDGTVDTTQYLSSAPVTSVNTKTGAVTLCGTDIALSSSIAFTVTEQINYAIGALTNKASKVSGATTGNLAAFTSVGDIADSGVNARYALPSTYIEPDPITGKYALNDREANWIKPDGASVTLVFPAPVSGRLRDFEVYVESEASGTGNTSVTCEGYDSSDVFTLGNGGGAVPDIPLGGETVLYFSEVKEGAFLFKGEEYKTIAQGGN